MKKAEHDLEGSNEISEHVEMAGWGVEEAEKANESHASTYIPLSYPLLGLFSNLVILMQL
jgi:hypothetical protein